MWIQKLKLKHFRNYADLQLELANATYFLIGKNGQGKTNILESLALNSLAKSFRSGKTFDLIQHGEGSTRIEIEAKEGKKTIRLAQYIGRSGHSLERAYWKDGIKVSLEDFFGVLKVVVFSPEQINLLLLGPTERRRYLNALVLQSEPRLLRTLGAYLSVLQNRNALLSRIRKGLARAKELDFWDTQIAEKGSEIVAARAKIIDELNGSYEHHFNAIAKSKVSAKILYKSGGLDVVDAGESHSHLAEAILALLFEKREADIEKGVTHVGPHRVNFEINVNKRNILSFGSRGELRTSILALKFAECDMFSKEGKPIILLDDVFSELDDDRRAMVMKLASEHQTFITTCEVEDLPKNRDESIMFRVSNAEIAPYES